MTRGDDLGMVRVATEPTSEQKTTTRIETEQAGNIRGESQDARLSAAFGVFNGTTAQMMLDQGCSKFHAWGTVL